MPPAKKPGPADEPEDEGVPEEHEISPSEEPLDEIGRDESGADEAKPRLHVFSVKNEGDEVMGWRWRFELGGETVRINGRSAASRADEPFVSRTRAIQHADRWGTREFGPGGFEGGARVMIPE